MTKQPHGLEKLFSNAQLEPDKRFVRDLSKQLGAPGEPKQHARRLGRRLATAGGVLLLSLVLIGVTTLRPAPKQLSRTVLLKQLYATAMADELPAPAQSTVTFWDVTQTASGGPAAQACNATIEPYTEHTILFKQGDTTALLTKITSNNIVGMSYSEDPDTPAFDPNVLSVAQNGQLSGLLQGAKLTDVNGTALPDDAATAIKTTGAYELYAAHATRLKDDSGPMPDCPVQLMDLKIDVATGMFADVAVYNGQVAPDKLAFELKQQTVTDTGDFATEEPKLVAEGFNLERAKAFAQSAVTNVANEPAGFEFWYRKAALGKATVSGDSDGVISYSFAKYPQVTFRVYTAQATGQEPKNLASLKATATASGWQILSDDVQHGIKYPGYSAADTELFTATDGTKDYAMFATGTPDAPYAYVELPVGLGDRTDPATGEQPSLSYVESQALSVANVFVFTPGSTVPVGAG